MVATDGFTHTYGRDSSGTVRAEAEIDTGETGTGRIVGQTETMKSGEEMGVVPEAMGIHPTSHTTKTDSVVDKKNCNIGRSVGKNIVGGKMRHAKLPPEENRGDDK